MGFTMQGSISVIIIIMMPIKPRCSNNKISREVLSFAKKLGSTPSAIGNFY